MAAANQILYSESEPGCRVRRSREQSPRRQELGSVAKMRQGGWILDDDMRIGINADEIVLAVL